MLDKKIIKHNKKQREKDDKILMLVKGKLNSIETLVFQALIDLEKCHEEFITIFREKDKYEKMKENVIYVSEKLEEKQENTRLNSVNSRT